jgi:hypothetical protein
MSLFFDGFEQYRAAPANPESYMRLAGYDVVGFVGLASGKTIVGVPPEQRTAISLSTGYVLRSHPWAGDLFTVGFSIKFTERGGLLRLITSNGNLDLWVSELTGLLNIASANGGVIPVRNNFYFIELQLSRSGQNVRVLVNGKQDILIEVPFSLAGLDSVDVRLNPNDIDPETGAPGGGAIAQGQRVYDDFYINAGDFMGPVAIFTRRPSSQDSVEWSNSTDFEGGPQLPNHEVAAAKPTLVPLDNFLHSYVDGATDNYRSNDSVSSMPVKAVAMIALARKTLPNPLGLTLFTDSHQVTFGNLFQQYSYHRDVLTSAIGYSKASIESSTFGIKMVRED